MPLLTFLSIANISGAAGDIMYLLFLIKLDKDIMFSELDDGTSFAILTDNDIRNKTSLGVQCVETQDEISRKDFKRIKVSKVSMIFLIICIVLVIIGFI